MCPRHSPGIFISYRRGDSKWQAGRLFDSLTARLPEATIFIDVEAIAGGMDFQRAVEDAVRSADVLLAVIGPGWAGAADGEGRHRILDDGDLVRIEIETGLRRGLRVIPVLLDGAPPPAADELPASIAALATRQAIWLEHRNWQRGVDELVAAVERAPPTERPDPGPTRGRQVRRLATVVQIRLELEAPAADAVDPELEAAALERAQLEVANLVEPFGGVVEFVPGAGLRLLFGADAMHEDDSQRAVRAVQEVRSAVAEATWADALAAAIAVDRGTLLVNDRAPNLDPTGQVLRSVQRLAEATALGEVRLSSDVAAALGDDVEVAADAGTAAESFVLAGFRSEAKPLAEFRSEAVGRPAELATIELAWTRAAAGTCQLITVLGRAGIGKSRLVHEALQSLDVGEGRVLSGNCLPYGRGITFWPIIEILKQAARISEGDEPTAAIEKLRALVAGADAAPAIASQLAAIIGLTDAVGSSSEEAEWAVRRTFEALAGDHGLVVVFEDLHWAEGLLLELLDRISERATDAPLLLICTARPELLETSPGWGGGKINAATIHLDALGTDETRTLIANVLGSRQASPELVDRLVAASEGNPLFVEQMIAALSDDGLLTGSESARAPLEISVPDSIQSLVAARVDGLPVEQREQTRTASIVGRIFYRDAVEALSEIGDRAEVRAGLTELTRKQIVRPRGSTFDIDDTYGFVHILLRDAAYSSLPKRSRAALHESFAKWLERRTGERSEEYDEIIGHHLERAIEYRRQFGDLTADDEALAEIAGRRLGSAGRHALGLGDVGAAENLLARSIALLGPGADRFGFSIDLFDSLLETGDLARAESLLSELADAPTRGDGGRTDAHLLIMTCLLRSHQARLDAGPDLLVRIDAGRDCFRGHGDTAGETRSLQLLADINLDNGQFAAAADGLEQALSLARSSAAAREESRIRTWLSSALYWGPMPAELAVARCEQLAAAPSHAAQARIRVSIAGLLAMQGDFDAARREFSAGETVLKDLGMNVAVATGKQVSGMIELLAGDLDASERELRTGYRDLLAMDQAGYAVGAAVFYARTAKELEHWDDVRELVAFLGGVPAYDFVAAAHRELLEASLATDRPERAITLAERAVASLRRTDDLRTIADALVDLARLARAAGDRGLAAYAVDDARRLYRQKGVKPALAVLRNCP